MTDRIRITHTLLINFLRPVFTDAVAITQTQRPRHLECHIPIRIHSCSFRLAQAGFILVFLFSIFVIILIKRLVVIPFILIFRVLIILRTEPLLPCIIIQCVRERTAISFKTSKTSIRPFCTVIIYHISVFIKLIPIRSKRCIHAESITLCQFQTQIHAQVTPRTSFSRRIISKRCR